MNVTTEDVITYLWLSSPAIAVATYLLGSPQVGKPYW